MRGVPSLRQSWSAGRPDRSRDQPPSRSRASAPGRCRRQKNGAPAWRIARTAKSDVRSFPGKRRLASPGGCDAWWHRATRSAPAFKTDEGDRDKAKSESEESGGAESQSSDRHCLGSALTAIAVMVQPVSSSRAAAPPGCRRSHAAVASAGVGADHGPHFQVYQLRRTYQEVRSGQAAPAPRVRADVRRRGPARRRGDLRRWPIHVPPQPWRSGT
jgi:hypothetical protein